MDTQDRKELLLKDLCARLAYGVKVQTTYISPKTKERQDVGIDVLSPVEISMLIDGYEEHKPYLFPLSSITDEQREELYKMGWYLDEDKIYSSFRNYDDVNYKTHIDCFELVNWCYKNNLDINGLIPMKLANDATGLDVY